MNRRITVWLLALVWLANGLPGHAPAASAAAAGLETYAAPFAGSSLTGYSASAQQFFEVEDYWKVQEAVISLDYKASPLVQSERSSVTLVMNGTPFHSFRPVAGDGAAQRLTVAVPKAFIAKGTNTLSIEGYLQTADTETSQLCVQADSQDKWLQIYNTSSVAVRYALEALAPSISDFNRYFLGLDTVSGGRNAVAVTTDGGPSELEAASYALSGLARANPLKDKLIPLYTYGDKGLKDKTAVVLVALYDHLPSGIKSRLPQHAWHEEAVIQQVETGGQRTLVVTSSNSNLLTKAGRLVANQELLRQMDVEAKVVTMDTEVDTPAVSVSRTVNLTASGDKLTGAMHREKTYFVTLPGNRSIADASKLSIDFRYARNLDFDRSLVTVSINDTPIGSKKLTAELADGDSINLPIPKTLNISGNFSVTIAFDLELLNASCIQNRDQMPWAFIGKDSILQVNTRDRADLLFTNYPYPFLRDGSYNQVAVVLPDKRDAYTYRTLANLFNLLGQYAATNTGDIRYYDGRVKTDELKDSQIIAIGGYADNPLIRDNNDKLYFRYTADGAGFRSNEKMSIEESYGRRIGTLQLIDSPYAAGHGLLAVTGADSEHTYLASKLLAKESTMWKVFGDGVATDSDGAINAFRFKKEAVQEEPGLLTDALARTDVLAFMTAVMLVAVLILLSLVLMIRKYRKRRRAQR